MKMSLGISQGLLLLKQPFPHGHALYPVPNKIREHGQGIHIVIVQVFTAYGKQRDLAHEFLILTTSISSIEEIEVFISGENWMIRLSLLWVVGAFL